MTRRQRPTGTTAPEHGQAAVELALAFPLLAVFLLAGVQLVVVGRDQLAVIHAAREGARAAAVSSSPGDGLGAARASTPLAVSVTVGSGGGVVRVTVTRRVPTDVPLVGPLLPDVTVRATATMRLEP